LESEHLAVAINGTLFTSNSGWLRMAEDLGRCERIAHLVLTKSLQCYNHTEKATRAADVLAVNTD